MGLFLSSPGLAQNGLGVRAGTGGGGAFFGANLTVLVSLLPAMDFEVSSTWWPGPGRRDSTSLLTMDGTFKVFLHPSKSPVTPYLGGGPSLCLGRAVFRASKAETGMGVHGAVGADIRLLGTPFTLGTQVKCAFLVSASGGRALVSTAGILSYGF